MFARDEIDEICQELVPIMRKQYPRRPPSNENLYDYFLSRVRQNLHVVLCFSPVGEKFRKRGKFELKKRASQAVGDTPSQTPEQLLLL